MLSEFHFIRPWWFAALLPLAVLLWYLFRCRLSSKAWEKVCDASLLPFILIGGSGHQSRRFFWLVGLAGVAAIAALAGPAWERLPQPVFRSEATLAIALDLSQSMNAVDIEPSRLARARFKIDDFLTQRQGGQFALIAFSDQAFPVVPMTSDVAAIRLFLQSVDTQLMPTQGSRPDLALKKARELIERAKADYGRILLVTDFVDERAISEAEILHADGFEISVLAVGTEQGGPIFLPSGNLLRADGETVVPKLDEAPLRRFAQAGGGVYQRFQQINNDDIQALLRWSESGLAVHASESEDDRLSDAWNERGPWLLLLLLPLVAAGFRKGLLLIAFCLFLPMPADAFEWKELWQRKDQRAMSLLEEDDAASAAEMFDDEEWKAVAEYRGGKFEEAAELLEQHTDARSLYNRGNALMHALKFGDALKSYNQALEIDPEMEDAIHNRDIAKQIIEVLPKEAMKGDQSGEEPPEDAEQMQAESDQSQGGDQSQEGDPRESEQQSDEQSDGDQNNAGEQNDGDEQADQGDQGERNDEGEQGDEDALGDQDGDSEQNGDQEESDGDEANAGDGGTDADSGEEMMTEEDQALEEVLRRVQERPDTLLQRRFRRMQSQNRQNRRQAPKEKTQW